MVDAWVPLSKLAVLADVSEPTTRRYVASKALSKFFRTRKEARLTLVHLDAVPILKRAYLLSCQGKKMEEIETIIPQEFPIILDVRPSPPTPDRQSSAPAPAIPDMMAALIPILDKYLALYERHTQALETIAAGLALQGPQDASKASRQGLHHPDPKTGQDGEDMRPVDRQAVIARVLELHGEGLGQHAVMTRVRREGLRLSTRGQLSKSTVARIIKGDVR